MKALTIKDLKKECEKQIKLGNGNKTIMISNDDEGNGYHYLWYSFMQIAELEEPIEFNGKLIQAEKIETDDSIAKHEDTIILG